MKIPYQVLCVHTSVTHLTREMHGWRSLLTMLGYLPLTFASQTVQGISIKWGVPRSVGEKDTVC